MSKSPDPRIEAFISLYLANPEKPNATQAAIDAGFTKNKRSAGVTASRLLKRANVRAEIKKRLAARCEKFDITGEKILAEYAKIAFATSADFPAPKTVAKKNRLRISMSDKKGALDALARYKGLLDGDHGDGAGAGDDKPAIKRTMRFVVSASDKAEAIDAEVVPEPAALPAPVSEYYDKPKTGTG